MLRPFAILPTMMILVACLIVAESNADLAVRLFMAVPLWVAALLLGLPGETPAHGNEEELAVSQRSEQAVTRHRETRGVYVP
jgi:hypothetical protein